MGTSSLSLDRAYSFSRKDRSDRISSKLNSNYAFPFPVYARISTTPFGPHNLLSYVTMIQQTQCSAPVPPPLPPLPDRSGTISEKTSSSPPPPPHPSSKSQLNSTQSSRSTATDSITQVVASVSSLTNPGLYESLLVPTKRLTSLETYDGFRCEIHKQLSPFMVAIHSFWLGTTMIPDGRMKTYTFATQVANEEGMLLARFDPDMGSIDGRVHKSLFNGLVTAKVQLGVSTERPRDQMLLEADINGDSWCGNVKYGSVANGNVFGLNYLQAITDRLSIGGEGMYVGANGGNCMATAMVKYEIGAVSGIEDEGNITTDNTKNVVNAEDTKVEKKCHSPRPSCSYSSSSSYSFPLLGKSIFMAQYDPVQNGLGLYFNRIVVPNRVTLGAELMCHPLFMSQALRSTGPGPDEAPSTLALGTEFQLTRSKVNLCVDGTGRIKSTLEAKLGMAIGSPTISFSVDIDHGKDIMKFGYGLTIGG